jgi:hypothetical protein
MDIAPGEQQRKRAARRLGEVQRSCQRFVRVDCADPGRTRGEMRTKPEHRNRVEACPRVLPTNSARERGLQRATASASTRLARFSPGVWRSRRLPGYSFSPDRVRSARQRCFSSSQSATGRPRSTQPLAGRFERITLTHWSASSLAEIFGAAPEDVRNGRVQISRTSASDMFSKFGRADMELDWRASSCSPLL